MFAAQHCWNSCLSHSQAGLKEPMSVKSTDAKIQSSFADLYWCKWEWKLFFSLKAYFMQEDAYSIQETLGKHNSTVSAKVPREKGVSFCTISARRGKPQLNIGSHPLGCPTVPLHPPCLLSCAQWGPAVLEAELWGLYWWLLRALCRVRMAGGPSSLMAKLSQERDVGSWSWSTADLRSQSLPFLLDYEGLGFW